MHVSDPHPRTDLLGPLAFALVLAGCGGGTVEAPPPPPPVLEPTVEPSGPARDPYAEAEELGFSLDDTATELLDAIEVGDLDCAHGQELTDRTCDLAEQVCAIADHYPDAGVDERCDDGRLRCANVREAFEQECNEQSSLPGPPAAVRATLTRG